MGGGWSLPPSHTALQPSFHLVSSPSFMPCNPLCSICKGEFSHWASQLQGILGNVIYLSVQEKMEIE